MRGGYFLDQDLREFDNSFFGINNLEATHMDPQQRILLEVAFECFESAGVKLDDIAGANVGCFVGNFTFDFPIMQSRDSEYPHRYTATGVGPTILSNRISHVFDLRGPSVTLDTACSSSLYSLHFACEAIARGNCDSAIVAASNLIQAPEQFMGTSAAGVLSGTGTCHSFSADADGYGRADAVGALYLKRLSDAIRDNDPIRSIVRGTAINANGRTPGITLPSAVGQTAVIAQAYKQAGLHPSGTTYIECHGTGTQVGDPIEVEAVANFFTNSSRIGDRKSPLLIGSVKSNLGHSEATSGITSVIKATLALEHQQIPPTVGIEHRNPKITWEQYNVDVVRSLTTWPKSSNSQAARAGINSFGYGGANSHAILERLQSPEVSSHMFQTNISNRKYILPISAKSESALAARVDDLASIDLRRIELTDLAYTLAERRTMFDWRGFIIVESSTVAEDVSFSMMKPTVRQNAASDAPLAFIFTGQGAQWPQMGRELIERSPTFCSSIARLDRELSRLTWPPSWSLREALLASPGDSKIHNPAVSQVVCTAVQIALVDLLRSWDIIPSFVVGHSSGEMAAAYTAGHFSSSFAIVAAYCRGQVVSHSTLPGAMMAVGMSMEEAHQWISFCNTSSAIVVGCSNSPDSTTLSGDAGSIEDLLAALQKEGKFARLLKTGGKAYHSHHMKLLGESYEAQLSMAQQASSKFDERFVGEDIEAIRRNTIMISSVYVKEVQSQDTCSPAYWRSNLESPVMFSSAVEQILSSRDCQFVEIGPHSALEMPIKQIHTHLKKQYNRPYLSAIYRGKDSESCALSLVGNLWTLGYLIDYSKVNCIDQPTSTRRPRVLSDLPNYRWAHTDKLWKEPRSSYEFRCRKFPRDELLGSKIPGMTGITTTWRNLLSASEIPWLDDHKLANDTIFPAAGYIAVASRAAQQTMASETRDHVLEIRNMHMPWAMVVPPNDRIEMFTELTPKKFTDLNESSTWWSFTISTFAGGQSSKHASGEIGFVPKQDIINTAAPEMVVNGEFQHSRIWYQEFTRTGLKFGPHFRLVSNVELPRMRNQMAARAEVMDIPSDLLEKRHSQYSFEIHPVAIDAQLQTGLIATTAGIPEKFEALVPTRIDRIQVWPRFPSRSFSECTVQCSSKYVGFGIVLMQTEMVGSDGSLISRMSNVKAAPFHGEPEETSVRQPMLGIEWVPDFSSITLQNATAFQDYLKRAVLREEQRDRRNSMAGPGALLRTLSRYREAPAVLCLGSWDKSRLSELLSYLDLGSQFQRFQNYTFGSVSNGRLVALTELDVTQIPDDPSQLRYRDLEEEPTQPFDVILFDETMDLGQPDSSACTLTKYLNPNDKLLMTNSTAFPYASEYGLQPLFIDLSASGCNTWTLATNAKKHAESLQNGVTGKEMLLVVHNRQHPLNVKLADRLGVDSITLQDLLSMTVPAKSTVIITVEMERCVLRKPTQEQFSAIKKITNNASKLLWLTSGSLADGQNPEMSLGFGLSRTVMAEQPSLDFSIIDIDKPGEVVDVTVSNLLTVLAHTSEERDHEFVQKEGILHVSRIVPNDRENDMFRQKKAGRTELVPLGDTDVCKLSITDPGQMDTLHFVKASLLDVIPEGHIEIQVKAVGINAKDLYTLSGKVETHEKTCSCELSGVVVRIGDKVTDFTPGDRAVSATPTKFGTYETVPAWSCCKIADDESFTTMAPLPTVFMTAVHAFQNLARLQEGESVLIHSAAGGVGLAAITLATELGAEIFITVGTDDKATYLSETFGINPSHIFSSRDTSFLSGVMKATNNRGVDVVLNSLTGDKLHASLECCAEFGRFIEIGKRDILDAGNLNMCIFERCITFSAFDLFEMFYSSSKLQQRRFTQLLQDALAVYRRLGGPKPTVFDAKDISAAFRHFSNRTRIGKIVVSFEDPTSAISYLAPKFENHFSAEKSYLLVGCLGGLGRSIARYMLSQGARHFSFIGRSGTDKNAARLLVDDLERSGATVDVVRGDVQDFQIVESAVARLQHPLGGVIQAAMALDESLFASMSHTQWNNVLGPKVQGTWNIHHAIAAHSTQLDFFLMTSSITGSIASVTEANYCAANAFLDAFARYRRSLGLPATALALGLMSGVGYVYEHAEIERMLARRGVAELTEDDMLLIIDIALSKNNSGDTNPHILTGIEPARLSRLSGQGHEAALETARSDPRLRALTLSVPKAGSTSDSGGLPAGVAEAVAAKDGAALESAVFAAMAERLSQLILVPMEKISRDLKLSEVGMDSMLAAEYRTFIFRGFGVDVPFLALMDAKSRMGDVVGIVSQQLLV